MDDNDVWATSDDPVSHEQHASTSSAQSPKADTKVTTAAVEDPFDDDLGAGWGSTEPSQAVGEPLDVASSEASHFHPPESAAPNSPEASQPLADELSIGGLRVVEDETADGDEDEFADFEDDENPQRSAGDATAKEDDFGDFGDFPEDNGTGEGVVDFGDEGFPDDNDFGEVQASQSMQHPVHTNTQQLQNSANDLTPLQIPKDVDVTTLQQSIRTQVQTLLSAPFYPGGPSDPLGSGASAQLSSDPVRQVEGPAQVLPAESSRKALADVTHQGPLRPVDWLRSRTRKDMYIALGVPINLDELETAGSSSSKLPPLALKLDSVSREAGPSSAPGSEGRTGLRRTASGQTLSSASEAGTGQLRSASSAGAPPKRSESTDVARRQKLRERRLEDLGLGPMPHVDMHRLNEVCTLTEDQLSLLPLASLKSLSSELESLAKSTSVLLTHSLTLRESLQGDSEMYNGLIKDLVRGAANTLSKDGSSNRRSMASSPTNAGGAAAPNKRFTSGSMGNGILSRSNSPRPQSPLSRPATGSASAAVRR